MIRPDRVLRRRARRAPSLHRRLLAVLVALSLPLLTVAPVGFALLHGNEVAHARSKERVRVASELSDLQTQVAGLTASLTVKETLEGDPGALLQFLDGIRTVEQSFDALRRHVEGAEHDGVERAYTAWAGLVDTLSALPPRFPALVASSAELRGVLSDVGTRLLTIAQVLNAAAAGNAVLLQREIDRAHSDEQVRLQLLTGLGLLGLALSVLTARWLHRRITHPLDAMQAAAQRLGAGHLDEPLVPDRTAELGALAVAFNQMSDRLADSRELLVAREQHFRALVQHSSDVVAVLDVRSVISYATPSVDRVLGVAAADLLGTRLLDRVHPDDRGLLAAALDAALSTDGPGETTTCRLGVGPSQAEQWCNVELVVNDLLDVPAVCGLVLTARDITEQTRLHEQLRHSAFHDELTGLANRVLFSERLTHALTGRDRQPPAVLYCDLDGFKGVNDTLGHAAGDGLLVVVGERLQRHLRPRDTAARLGGDEFAVLLEDVSAAEALATARRLLAAVAEPVTVDGVDVVPRISIGVATANLADAGASGAEELMRQADLAMYQAKHRPGGGHDVVVFDADLAGDLLDRLELTGDLQRALVDGQFVLHYQPTVDLRTGQIGGVEALVRWQHPVRGIVSPLDFIPLAEETGLIVKLGLWVLEAACAQLAAWQDARPGLALHLNVNLSGRQLEQPGVVDDVASVLALTGLDPALLTLELTESVLVDRSEQVLQRLHALKALGLKLAIDDFGTGYSSLSYLQRLPIDILKIDKSFVDVLADLDPDSAGEALAATIVTLARTLGLGSVAEGIEHPAQADALRALGCDSGQGYLYARPLTADALQHLLATQGYPQTAAV